jgi:hypothetical protein
MPYFFKKLFKKIRDPSGLFWTLFMLYLCFHLIQSCVWIIVEDKSFLQSQYLTLQTNSTVGYGDDAPNTNLGKILIMLLCVPSIGLLGGSAISVSVDIAQKKKFIRRHGLIKKNPNKNGVIIIHLPNEYDFKLYVEEVRHVDKDLPICIVDNRFDELPVWVISLCNEIVFVKGSLTDDTTYERANIAENEQVIIFPKDPDDPESDYITDSISSVALKHASSTTNITCVVVDPANLHLFEAEKVPNLSCSLKGMGILALVQQTHGGFTIEWFIRLMSNTKGANPSTVKVDYISGWTWAKFVKATLDLGLKGEDSLTNPLAIIRPGTHPVTNPAPNDIISKNDWLIIANFNNFIGWEKYEQML